MSQRGGSVFSHVRFGERVHSPLIPQGEADFLVSFEEMETLRWTRFTRHDTVIIVNRMQIPPMAVTRGKAAYPADVMGVLWRTYREVLPIDAHSVAVALGHPRVANTVMLGYLAVHLDFRHSLWREVVAELVPTNTVDVNLQAFHEGWSLGAEPKGPQELNSRILLEPTGAPARSDGLAIAGRG
jgi:indolepyruvate ferredoxin oxidoreductase beta subunit